jgi:hypothetical protein
MMTVNPNKLDVTLTPEETAAVGASVASLYSAMPFLVTLTTSEIRQLPKLGDKSEAFVRQAHQIARDHPAALPLGLSVEQMDRDQAIRDLLLPVHQQLTQLLTMVNSTLVLAGSDLMQASLIIYRCLQSHGDQVGLREVRDELARRFAKAPREKVEQFPDATLDSPDLAD